MGKKHVHKYHRMETPSGKLWFCALPDCNHHMPKHYEPSLPGKNSVCWNCESIFMLDPIAMRDDEPICSNCRGVNDDVLSLLGAVKQ